MTSHENIECKTVWIVWYKPINKNTRRNIIINI